MGAHHLQLLSSDTPRVFFPLIFHSISLLIDGYLACVGMQVSNGPKNSKTPQPPKPKPLPGPTDQPTNMLLEDGGGGYTSLSLLQSWTTLVMYGLSNPFLQASMSGRPPTTTSTRTTLSSHASCTLRCHVGTWISTRGKRCWMRASTAGDVYRIRTVEACGDHFSQQCANRGTDMPFFAIFASNP